MELKTVIKRKLQNTFSVLLPLITVGTLPGKFGLEGWFFFLSTGCQLTGSEGDVNKGCNFFLICLRTAGNW